MKIKFPALALCVLLNIAIFGCGGPPVTAPPTESAATSETGTAVLTFIEKARKNPATAKQDLDILMETLDAQAEQFGGELLAIQSFGKDLQAKLGSGTPDAETLNSSLDEMESLVKVFAPDAKPVVD